MEQIRVSQNGSDMMLTRIDTVAKDNAMSRLAEIGASGNTTGITDGELLLALAKKRGDWDPFAIFLRVYGNIASVLGGTITGIIGIFSLVLFALWVKDRVEELGSWIRKLMGFVPGFSFSNLFSDKERQYDAAASSLSGASFAGMIEMMLPGPVYRAISSAVGGSWSSGSPAPQQGPTTVGFPSVSQGLAAINPISGATSMILGSAANKLANFLKGTSDNEFTPAEIAALENATGRSISELLGS